MSFNFTNETPIFLQIIEHIKSQIISREYLPNQKIPSVRELSLIYEVNPNTVQKALLELENLGLIYTERTNGKFVTNNEATIQKHKEQTIKALVDSFYNNAKKLGVTKEEVLEILNNKESL